jgi:hypothetical protein
MTKSLLLAMTIVFAVSTGVGAHEPITKKYQNELAATAGGPSRQEEALKLAMGPVSAPQLPSGSLNNSSVPSSRCPASSESCTNQHVRTRPRRKHHN